MADPPKNDPREAEKADETPANGEPFEDKPVDQEPSNEKRSDDSASHHETKPSDEKEKEVENDGNILEKLSSAADTVKKPFHLTSFHPSGAFKAFHPTTVRLKFDLRNRHDDAEASPSDSSDRKPSSTSDSSDPGVGLSAAEQQQRRHPSRKPSRAATTSRHNSAANPADDDSELLILWRSRDNRKRKQSLAYRRSSQVSRGELSHRSKSEAETEEEYDRRISEDISRAATAAALRRKRTWKKWWLASPLRHGLLGTGRMFTTLPYWDMAYWVGFWYSLGSLIFVIEGLMGWLPIAFPRQFGAAADSLTEAIGIMGFLGVMMYEVGAAMSFLEAVNEGCWHGAAMRRLIDGCEGVDDREMFDRKVRGVLRRLDPRQHRRGEEERRRRGTLGCDEEGNWDRAVREAPRSRRGSLFVKWRRGAVDEGRGGKGDNREEDEDGMVPDPGLFRLWPTWRNFREHHVHDLGFWSVTAFFIGATIYCINGITGLPGILDTFEPWQENLAYWLPQMVASVGFITGSLLLVFETQEKWWKPEPMVLGWWAGAFSTAGSVGFELCAALGPATYKNNGALYQSDLSEVWGSMCFLIAGLLLMYEAVNKNPIGELFDEPGPLKSWQVRL